MISSNLDNLTSIGKLKREEPSARELRGLLESAERLLTDLSDAAQRLCEAVKALPAFGQPDKQP
ncbi:MAG: hypothetical protein OXQ89_02215 [Rhodospirillaceae bacterium]|nr:hypothetical protein [Rhodospirillaceae bacterium]MDE0362565.1 hypothetical protein [Rhodospirillaceae bacterium]